MNKQQHKKMVAQRKAKNTAKAAAKAMARLGLGGTIGAMAGPGGSQLGKMVDRAVAKAIRKPQITGRGTYIRNTTKVNSKFASASNIRSNEMSIGSDGEIYVTRREYLARILAPAAGVDFENRSFYINPGSDTFEFLRQIAVNFDEYSFNQLLVSIEPVISRSTTTGAMGSILTAANYNAGAADFDSFRQMVEYDGAINTRVCDPCVYGLECSPKHNAGAANLYVAPGGIPYGEDIKTYHLAKLQIAVADIAADFSEGTLLAHSYITYKVRLMKPKIFSSLGMAIPMDKYRKPRDSNWTSAEPFGDLSSTLACASNTFGGVLQNVAGNLEYWLPAGFTGTITCRFYTDGETNVGDSKISHGTGLTTLTSLGVNGNDSDEDAGTVDEISVKYFEVHEDQPKNKYLRFSVVPGAALNLGGTITIAQVNPLVANNDTTWISI